MTQEAREPDPPEARSPGSPSPETPPRETPPPTARGADAERGLRGVMSAILVLETIVILLGIPVAAKTGNDTGPVGVGVICALAAAHLAACAVVSRRYAVGVIGVLQALLIACWAINGSLGVMGIVFAIVWSLVLYMRREYRRRLAAGLLPAPAPPAAPPAPAPPAVPAPRPPSAEPASPEHGSRTDR